MREITRDQSINYLNVIMLSEVLLEAVESLKGTPIYKHGLKSKINLLIPELEKVTGNDMQSIWGVDDRSMYHLMEEQKKLTTRLASTRPEIWNMLNELLDMYEEDREAFLERNEIKISE